jgi:hypothetical protein
MYKTNVIINRSYRNSIENFKEEKKEKKEKKEKSCNSVNNNVSFRKRYQSELECIDGMKDIIESKIPQPVDSISSTNGEFEFKGSCAWEKNDNMSISTSKLGSCPGCPINYMGSIKASPKECKKWCGSVPGCNAITTEDGRCHFRNQAYYTEPSIDEDSYFKSLENKKKWIVKKNRKIPDSTMYKNNVYNYQYNNLSGSENEQYPYYPRPYQMGLSPDFASIKNSCIANCKYECKNNKDCNGFTFNHRNRECTMKKNVINGEYNTKASKGKTSYLCD